MKFFIILFFFFFIKPLYAYQTDHVKVGDTLQSIAKRNFQQVKIKYGDRIHDYEEDLKKWNPKITDWNKLQKSQLLYVDYPYDPSLQGSTWTPTLGKFDDANEYDQKFSLAVFYASSFGSYKETTSEQTVDSGQNFPVTLGMASSLTNAEKIHFLLASIYWAQSSKGTVAGNSTSSTKEFSTPGELGFNTYYQYYMKDRSLGVYSGYDFEKLNTFNTSQIVSGSPVENVDNQIHYVTAGMFYAFEPYDLKMTLKASISKTLASTTSGTVPLTGYKYIFYYTIKPLGPLNLSFFYKHHELKGPTNLSINRIGFSIGFALF